MNQYEYIRTGYRVYGKSIRELARETGHSRNTIRKMVAAEHQSYAEREYQPYPVLGRYLELIDRWLESDRPSPVKQRHTARRIYRRLREEEGYEGSESAVRRYVREAKRRLGVGAPGAFIPLEPDCGQEAEADWGAAQVTVGGEPHTVKFFCLRSKYSGMYYVRCYPCERQAAFFDGHIRAFDYFGGVFPRIIYDNLSSAVQTVYCGKRREEQESYTRFRSYYSFESVFCNPGQGHEKGGVEGLVGYIRRNHLVPIPKVATLTDLNEDLLRACQAYGAHRIHGRSETVGELFAGEHGRLVPLPSHPYSNVHVTQGRIDKFSTVVIDRNRYSTPTRYVGLVVKVAVTVDRVTIVYGTKTIAEHGRQFGENHWVLELDHYLELLSRRPYAFPSARPVRASRASWPESYERLLSRFQERLGLTKGVKEFITVLLLGRTHDPQAVQAAVDQALAQGLSSSDGIIHLLNHAVSPPAPPPVPTWPTTPPADVSVYAGLGGGL